MPELPEVETVRRGLEPVLVGNAFARVEQRRPDLRFPLPKRFAERLAGRAITGLERRAKYLLARLDDGHVLVMHLGMTGRFAIEQASGERSEPGDFAHEPLSEFGFPKHEHIVFHLGDGSTVRYSDVRRFGIMDLVSEDELEGHALFKGLGIEPLGDGLTPAWLSSRLKGKTTPIKAALLDQRLIAGLGNIYVCEALFRARVSPKLRAGTLATKTGRPTEKTTALVKGVQSVLRDAIRSGGSSLRDYRHADGSLGRFQHRFRVYGRAGERCLQRGCDGIIQRIAQGGRSSFYCPICQR
ncbi:MAG: bifunctional DNA-formamidopyrimidine glycosylase/DNA-(apurinic or apyrimidinic site) lyase [Pseudomonadota bacterium]